MGGGAGPVKRSRLPARAAPAGRVRIPGLVWSGRALITTIESGRARSSRKTAGAARSPRPERACRAGILRWERGERLTWTPPEVLTAARLSDLCRLVAERAGIPPAGEATADRFIVRSGPEPPELL